MKRQRNTTQLKEHIRNTEVQINEEEIGKLPEKEFRIMIGVPKEEEKKKGYEKIFEVTIVENLPNMEKEIVNQVQQAQKVPCGINARRNMPRHILIKQRLNEKKEY